MNFMYFLILLQNLANVLLFKCSYYFCKFIFVSKMARKKELSMEEKNKIVQKLGLGKRTLEISKEPGTDHRTIKKIG